MQPIGAGFDHILSFFFFTSSYSSFTLTLTSSSLNQSINAPTVCCRMILNSSSYQSVIRIIIAVSHIIFPCKRESPHKVSEQFLLPISMSPFSTVTYTKNVEINYFHLLIIKYFLLLLLFKISSALNSDEKGFWSQSRVDTERREDSSWFII